jgi:hypothetical protein
MCDFADVPWLQAALRDVDTHIQKTHPQFNKKEERATE